MSLVKVNVEERTRRRLKRLAAEQGVSMKDLISGFVGDEPKRKVRRRDVWDFQL